MPTDHHQETTVTTPEPLERSTGALASGDDATPTPPLVPDDRSRLAPHGDPLILDPGFDPFAMLPRALEVDDRAVDRLADALDLGRADDPEDVLRAVIEALDVATDAEALLHPAARRLIAELETKGYRIVPIGGLDR